MSSLLYLLGSSLPSWLLILLLGFSGAQGQEEIQVLQPKHPISVAEGETVTLNCTISGIPPAGPVKWFKGKGPQRQEIYNFKGGPFPRIMTADPSSNMDFSINISHITSEDLGTYYCIKFKKGNPETEFKSGGGTMLCMRGRDVSGQFFVIFLLGLKVLLLLSISWLYVIRKQKIKVSEAALSVPISSAPVP
ncbi:signal-regulatory protein beta-1-like [Dromiciops gliroides]|uniref:signal-regulatory protein beta-1-like n=1 Tax=Dromiciops gliroides TaxID=33562 RepID=UPI001CC3B4D9|nr:signal-regulatory protein beta-1-like [Dromiciops gliroides]